MTAPTPRAQEVLKQAWTEARQMGERLAFARHGQPEPASAWLLASSGRSGSTWLGDVLAATAGTQQIFEPLDPRNSEVYRQLMKWPAGLTPSAFKRHYLRPDANAPAWAAFWDDVLRGRVRTYLTDYTRTSFFPRRFLVKSIRANMMLGFVAGHFRPRILFLVRHPSAVINSMFYRVRASWPADVQDLLSDENLVEDYLQPWAGIISQVRDGFEALAVWWAVENRVALTQLANVEYYLIFYEDIVLHPQETLSALFSWLDIPAEMISADVLRQFSRMTSVKQRQFQDNDKMKRLTAWQDELSLSEQRVILQWAERLEIPWYGADALPAIKSGPRGDR